MVTIVSLWLPVLVAAILVWVAAALIWTVLPHHKTDYKALPNEEAARSALEPQSLAPGQYNVPHLESEKELKNPEARQKFEQGPVAYITVLPRGVPNMGKAMAFSFLYYLVVGTVVAYVAGRTLAPGAHYLEVFRVTGTLAWAAYGLALVPDAIWFGRPWPALIKQLIDALVYGLLTASVFGWLWPAAVG